MGNGKNTGGYTYEAEITSSGFTSNIFSGWKELHGTYSVEGNKLIFKAGYGETNNRHPRYEEAMRESSIGWLNDAQNEEAVFEYNINGGNLQLRWIDGTLDTLNELNLSKVFMFESERKSESLSNGGGGCFGVLAMLFTCLGILTLILNIF